MQVLRSSTVPRERKNRFRLKRWPPFHTISRNLFYSSEIPHGGFVWGTNWSSGRHAFSSRPSDHSVHRRRWNGSGYLARLPTGVRCGGAESLRWQEDNLLAPPARAVKNPPPPPPTR